MKLELLICTLDERIARVPDILLPARPDISYLVSMQYTDPKFLGHVPDMLRQRPDVRLIFLEGKGLSRNRNHCLDATTGDLALIVDDDCRYREEYFDRVRSLSANRRCPVQNQHAGRFPRKKVCRHHLPVWGKAKGFLSQLHRNSIPTRACPAYPIQRALRPRE